jgi:hypothetical protein
VVVSLPSAVADLCAGGGGRYLVLHLPGQRQLAVFDASAAKVVKSLPVGDDRVKFAAGRDKLFVHMGGSGTLARWSLTTFEREAAVPYSPPDLQALCMGSAADGPLGVVAGGTINFVDTKTLQPLAVEWAGGKTPVLGTPFVRASADGRVFAGRDGVGGEPHTERVVFVEGRQASFRERWSIPPSVLVPGPDGRTLFSGYGLYNNDLQPLEAAARRHEAKSYLPAEHGPWYVQLEPGGPEQGRGTLSFFVPGQPKAFARLEDVEGVFPENISYGKLHGDMAHDRRVHLIPDARLLVTLPASNDRLVLHRFDPEAALERSGLDYLVVTSQAPPAARKGAEYRYQVRARAHGGAVAYRLDAGPPGMEVSPGGAVTWAVPADFKEPEADVLITVSAGGQEVLHGFKVRLEK